MKKKKIFIIAGAPGVGKTTIIKDICSKLPKAAHVSIDRLRKFARGGYASPKNWSIEVEKQYRLARKNAADISRNFLDAGYVVFVDDVFRDSWKEEFQNWLKEYEIGLIYLRTDLDIIINRDAARQYVVGEKLIIDCYEDLEIQNTSKKGWTIIENKSLDDVSEKILSIVS
ncbi:MAG: AAA family ATPase [Patescibacteria group bacterium]|jgi:tRNA uridine 5-carbamoylmethylation protein Kti12